MEPTNDLADTLRRAVAALTSISPAYHLTGGLLSSYYGEPRLTQDIDFVVQLNAEQASQLADALASDFYIDADAIRQAVEENSMFQALDNKTFIKVDFHVGEDIPGELSRSHSVKLFGTSETSIASKVDAILSKLLWIKQGSGKSRQDVLGMLLDEAAVDESLLNRLADEIGVARILQELRQEADRLR